MRTKILFQFYKQIHKMKTKSLVPNKRFVNQVRATTTKSIKPHSNSLSTFWTLRVSRIKHSCLCQVVTGIVVVKRRLLELRRQLYLGSKDGSAALNYGSSGNLRFFSVVSISLGCWEDLKWFRRASKITANRHSVNEVKSITTSSI